MTDYLLEISKNKTARNLVGSLGLPIPLPQALERLRGPALEKPLSGRRVAFTVAEGGVLGSVLETTIAGLGADVVVAGTAAGDAKLHGLVLDATGISSPAGLRALYDFFHATVKQLGRCGRVVVLGRPVGGQLVAGAAAQAALEGFIKSTAKEIGRSGSTANLIRVASGAEDRVAGPLRFFLSPASAFVSAQAVEVSTKAAGTVTGEWTRPLSGKVAVVTGAARGIGAATARILAGEGAQVVCIDRPADEAVTQELSIAIGGTAFALDVATPEAGPRLAAFLKERFGGVDIVVHNAGITRDKTLARMSEEAWDQVLNINLAALLRITEALLDGTLRDGGRIVCLSSIAGIAGNVGQTNYAASKAGVIGFVRGLAVELAPRGIAVNAVAPGFIETRMTATVPFAIREAGRRLAALGQGGQPEDVGRAIAFLSSPGALGLSGNVLRVCGGALLGA